MFWNNWFNKKEHHMPGKPKLKPPGDLPQQVGRYLVVNLQRDPDWVWNLRAVVRPVEGAKKSVRRFRVFDPVQSASRGIKIFDYTSLDACPEIILYEGEFDKDSHAVSLAAPEPARAA